MNAERAPYAEHKQKPVNINGKCECVANNTHTHTELYIPIQSPDTFTSKLQPNMKKPKEMNNNNNNGKSPDSFGILKTLPFRSGQCVDTDGQ